MADNFSEKIRKMCQDRATSHNIFADRYKKIMSWDHSPRKYLWHTSIRNAYHHLASNALDPKKAEDVREKMENMDACVLKSMAFGILLEHCSKCAE